MAITQSQADKNWQDSPSTTTPIMAADLKAVSKANRDQRWLVPSTVTSIDEFDDDTIDPAWVRVDSSGTGAPAANATWTERGDVMSLYQAGGDSDSVIRGLMRPLSAFGGSVAPGDAFVTSLRMWGSQSGFIMGGLILSDGTTHGTGNQAASLIFTQGTYPTVDARAGTNWTLAGSPGNTAMLPLSTLFLRLVCVTASTWRTDTSPDGVSWVTGATPATKAFTPTHVGLLSSSWGTATKGALSYEFLRRVSGVS